MSSDIQHKVIVGLEIHVQLCTRSKMFCGCAVEFGAEANSRVCPVCLGMPGVLPVMNRQAFEYAVLAGLALNCEVPSFTKWDRKSYYYPDLPKNYQISQYDLPLAEHGFIEIPLWHGLPARESTAKMAVPRNIPANSIRKRRPKGQNNCLKRANIRVKITDKTKGAAVLLSKVSPR